MAPVSRAMMRLAMKAGAAARQQAAATARQRAGAAAAARQRGEPRKLSYCTETKAGPLTVKDVEAIVDKKLMMKGIGNDKWFDIRSAARNAVTIGTSGVVTALIFAYIEKSNELTKKEVMLFIHQRDEAKEGGKKTIAEPPQQRKLLGIFRY